MSSADMGTKPWRSLRDVTWQHGMTSHHRPGFGICSLKSEKPRNHVFTCWPWPSTFTRGAFLFPSRGDPPSSGYNKLIVTCKCSYCCLSLHLDWFISVQAVWKESTAKFPPKVQKYENAPALMHLLYHAFLSPFARLMSFTIISQWRHLT